MYRSETAIYPDLTNAVSRVSSLIISRSSTNWLSRICMVSFINPTSNTTILSVPACFQVATKGQSPKDFSSDVFIPEQEACKRSTPQNKRE